MQSASPPPPPDDRLPVLSLVCHAHVAMAVRGFASLLACCRDPVRLVFLDDGSLDAADVATLAGLAGDVRVVSKAEMDERTPPLVARHPAVARYRDEHVMGLKLVDAPLLGYDRFVLCDTDVLFRRPFTGLAADPAAFDVVFMREFRDTYSAVYRDRYLRWPPLRLPEGCNAGFMAVSRSAYDLDRIEHFLSNPRYRVWPWLVEQTAWGVLAGQCRAGQFAADQVCDPDQARAGADAAVAIHYHGHFRPGFAQAPPADPGGPALRLRVEPAEYLGLIRTTVRRVRRRLTRPA